MNFKIEATEIFSRQSKSLKKKYPSLAGELAELEKKLSENPRLGISLGNNTYKVRLGIKSKGKGKSGGARIITYIIDKLSHVYLISIYDKSEIGSVDNSTIRFYTKLIDQTTKS